MSTTPSLATLEGYLENFLPLCSRYGIHPLARKKVPQILSLLQEDAAAGLHTSMEEFAERVRPIVTVLVSEEDEKKSELAEEFLNLVLLLINSDPYLSFSNVQPSFPIYETPIRAATKIMAESTFEEVITLLQHREILLRRVSQAIVEVTLPPV